MTNLPLHTDACGMRGYAAAELLSYLVLSIILGTIAMNGIRSVFTLYRGAQAGERRHYQARMLDRTLAAGFYRSRALYAVPGVLVHEPGRIVSAQGNSLGPTGDTAPDEKSTPISFLELGIYGLLKKAIAGNTDIFCAENGAAVRAIDGARLWIALGADGFYFVEAKIRRLPLGDSQCMTHAYVLTDLHSAAELPFGSQALLDSTQQVSEWTSALIPIESCYTIYLDRQGILRRLSHLGQENQPLIRGLQEFRVSEESVSEGMITYSATFSLQSKSTRAFTYEMKYLLRIYKRAHVLNLIS